MLAAIKLGLIRACPILVGTLVMALLASPILGQGPPGQEPSPDGPTGPPSGAPIDGAFFSSNTFTFYHPWVDGVAEFPVQGRANVSENNLVLPDDRFFFYHNHFNNGLNDSIAGTGDTVHNRVGRSVDRYTLGIEKTFLGEQMSVELRMPTFGSPNALDGGFTGDMPGVGNLRLITKILLYRSDFLALTAGVGFTVPTGDDTQFLLTDQIFTVKNQAVHFLPYFAYLAQSDRFFYQGFIQLDAPTIGNEICFRDIYQATPKTLGRLNDQMLGYIDLQMGYWIRRDPQATLLTQLALQGELHYAGTLQDSDWVKATTYDTMSQVSKVDFGNSRNRFNVVNATIGIHTEFRNRIAFRVAGVVPLTSGDDRFFDSEIHASVIYRY